MKFVTREWAKVDRIACPWLISRFVDPGAEFIFVPADKVWETARQRDAMPFDVEGAELGHHGNKCSFDAIIKKFDLRDPGLSLLAEIVRGADIPGAGPPESPGLKAIALGFHHISEDDHDNMHMQFAVYDALLAYCRERAKGQA